MAVKQRLPLVREVAWAAVGPQIVILAALIGLAHVLAGPRHGVAVGAGLFLLWSLGSRRLLAGDHRRGIALTRAGKHREAIAAYERSLAFFEQRPWLDRYRAILMLSASRMAYREMALANIAYCWGQLGEGARMKAAYERVAAEYPGNPIATAALRQIAAIEAANRP